MHSSRSAAGLFLATIVSLCACGEGRSQELAAQSASAQEAGPDPAVVCKRVCERSTRCGIEASEQLVKGQPNEAPLLEKLRGEAKQRELECNQSCVSGSRDEDQKAMKQAAACVEQTSCATFERCLETAARNTASASDQP